jgi:AcrR family transcriptional regulator
MSVHSLDTAVANRGSRRKARTRRDLLAAAVAVFAEKGAYAATVADIAARADVGVGTVYLHFATKDALFEAVVDETAVRLKAAVDEARAAAASPSDQTRLGTHAFCRFAQDHRELFKIVFGQGAHHDVIRRAQALFAADIERTVREGIASGEFAPVPPAPTAQALVGMATQVLDWWTEQDDVPMSLLEETLTTLALTGLRPTAPARITHAPKENDDV